MHIQKSNCIDRCSRILKDQKLIENVPNALLLTAEKKYLEKGKNYFSSIHILEKMIYRKPDQIRNDKNLAA